ncbi:monocarboxylate transporter 5 isoform X2 [Rousettus aegyptiacus]|uniref:monocarboxylate transporter 5 isoform X2 n=1 Tax=Rousettus aegyptiacus TaxID=9407 RepID=UPI00168D539F|nr:monocarboxylate transporter 5 isoform X2 [Rousettus aegyptiacus]
MHLGHRTCILKFVNVFVVGMVKNSAIFFAVFQEEFESTSQQTGWIGSIMASLSIAAGPLVAIIADTYDDKTVSILGAFLITGGFLISSQATSIPFLCVTMGVLPGLGSAFLYQVAVVLISKYFKKRLALSTAISRAGMGLTFLLAPFTKFLIDQYDWTGALIILGAIILNLVPSSMLLRPIHITSNSNSDFKDEGSGLSASGPEAEYGAETSYCNKPQESTIIRDCTVQKPGQSSTSLTDSQNQNKEFNDGPNRNRLLVTTNEQRFEKKSILWSCKQKLSFISLFKNPFFCIITWSLIFSRLAFVVTNLHLVAIARTLGIDMMDASYLLSVAGITESVSQIISGWIADRNWIKKYHYLQFYLIVCSITDLFGPLATTFPLLMTYTIFSAMFSGGYLALIVPVLVDLSAESVTHRFYGFAFFFTGIGTLPGPPIAGWLHDSSQTYAGSFYFSSTCYLLSSVSLFFIPLAERRKKQRLTRRKEDSNQV